MLQVRPEKYESNPISSSVTIHTRISYQYRHPAIVYSAAKVVIAYSQALGSLNLVIWNRAMRQIFLGTVFVVRVSCIGRILVEL